MNRISACCDVSCGRIPTAVLAAVLLGIWTPGTDLELGVPISVTAMPASFGRVEAADDGHKAGKDSPYRSMGAISRFDEAMDQQRCSNVV